MPQIIAAPVDLFTVPTAPVGALLPRQVNPSLPVAATLASATSMILPGQLLAAQLAHFPEGLYDLRPTSHLVRLMAALLGDAGAGQLRKRQLVARLSATVTGANWLDHDRFYGAVFSMGRDNAESLGIDPAADTATVEEWDALEAADAAYRERIIALAATIPMAGTLPGLVAAASAIISAPVEATETWRLLDTSTVSPARTWGQVAALGNYSVLDGQRWFAIENLFTIGLSGVDSRAEVVLRPHKTYSPDRAGAMAAAADARALTEILSRLTPDGILITVDTAVAAPGVDVPIAAAWADSSYAETCPQVTPSPALPAATRAAVYPLSRLQTAGGVDPASRRYLPRPPGVFTTSAAWDFNAAITATAAYAYTPDPATGAGDAGTGTAVPGAGAEQVAWRDGTSASYGAALAPAPAALDASSRLGAAGSLVAHPYSGSRRGVPVHA